MIVVVTAIKVTIAVDIKGSKEYSQVLVAELSIQPHLKDLISAAKYLVEK